MVVARTQLRPGCCKVETPVRATLGWPPLGEIHDEDATSPFVKKGQAQRPARTSLLMIPRLPNIYQISTSQRPQIKNRMMDRNSPVRISLYLAILFWRLVIV
jgi:hypothetical protein